METPDSAPTTTNSPTTSRSTRLVGLLVSLPCFLVLGVAWWLSPSSKGYGTHRQLGLPVCSWIRDKGIPCPTCGMTTSVTAMAHGDVAKAFEAQPFGIVLTIGLLCGAVVGLTQVLSGRNILGRLRFRLWWVLAILGGGLAGWGIKLAWGYAEGRYPLH